MNRTVVIAIVALLLFLGAGWAGMWYRRVSSVDQQLAQPGWCCIGETQSCTAVTDDADCRAKGGSSFNWDVDICNRLCL